MPSDPQTPPFLKKIVSREDAPRSLAALPRPIVFTNGVFDVLHRDVWVQVQLHKLLALI